MYEQMKAANCQAKPQPQRRNNQQLAGWRLPRPGATLWLTQFTALRKRWQRSYLKYAP
jgi:hypothetical protein